MSKIDTKQPAPSVNDPESVATRQPVLIIAVGRQRVGKTTLLNVLIEAYRSLGAQISVWNGDLHNRTHTLSLFHKDALEPPADTSVEDQKRWIEERVQEQVLHKRDTVLDVGGGLTALNTLIEEMRLVEMLDRRGIRVVLMYVLGNERADLDYLERFAENSMFMPKATLLVFNAGLLTSGRSAKTAFNALMDHSVVVKAMTAGAEAVQMPALSCMAAVTDRGLSFADFAAGKQVQGHPETSFFDQERVWLWLNRDMPRFFLEAPAEWMPATTQPLSPKV
jgi:hypothetical protein